MENSRCSVRSIQLQLVARVAGVRNSWTLWLAHFLQGPNQECRQAASPCLWFQSPPSFFSQKNLWLDDMNEIQGSLEAADPPVTKCHQHPHLFSLRLSLDHMGPGLSREDSHPYNEEPWLNSQTPNPGKLVICFILFCGLILFVESKPIKMSVTDGLVPK